MKILYAVQATGNGHISRAMELLPFLKEYGEVDLFLSGSNSTLQLDAPIRYRSKGISLFYDCNGQLDIWKMLSHFHPLHIYQMTKDLPVEKYDVVLNDFEAITSLACARKKIPSIQFGHQASFQSKKTPRPEKINNLGEWILLHYAKATHYFGLHFECYDKNIYSPVIKKQIREAEPTNKGHITVYLPAYCMNQLQSCFSRFSDLRFEIFAHEIKSPTREHNIVWMPVSKDIFNKSMIGCDGMITGGGFETPAEGLYLKKKMIAIPISGQYEQQCNAAALKRIGVPVLKSLEELTIEFFENWHSQNKCPDIRYKHTTEEIVEELMNKVIRDPHQLDIPYPESVFY